MEGKKNEVTDRKEKNQWKETGSEEKKKINIREQRKNGKKEEIHFKQP